MTRMALPILLLAPLACSAGSRLPRTASGGEVLEVRGAVKGAPFHLGEPELASLKQGKVRGVDPVTGREAVYEGLDLAALEDRVELAGGADTLVFRTEDGQAVAVPLPVIRELKPVLARPAEAPSAGELLVAWPNLAHHGLTSDPRAALWWARRVVALEYAAWAKVYGRALRLPEGAPAGARAGATAFGARCLACHGLRGAGGRKAADLTRTARISTAGELASVLPGHPGWASPGAAAPPPELIPHLAAFLDAAARAPPEEAGAEEREPAAPPALPREGLPP